LARRARFFVTTALLATALPASLDAGAAVGRFSAARPALCSRGEIKTVVERFAGAFNRGAFRILDQEVFAQEPEFHWYSSGGPGARLNRAAHNRASLISHLRTRWNAGDRLDLVELRPNGNSRAPDAAPYGNFQFRLIRHPGERARLGKGAVYCYRGRPDRIIVWSMGNAGSG
jgi:hypothetical protein